MTEWTANQRRAISGDGFNLIVSASAGSGKTAVLVERVVSRIADGGDVGRMVVLTFTKDAARETRERIAAELFRKIRLDPGNERLKAQAEKLPFADISTIDGYCLKLVKRYFNEIGEESNADVLSADEEAVLLSDAADEAAELFFEQGDPDFFELLDRFIERRDVKILKESIFRLHRFLGVQAEREEFISLAKRTASAPFEERATTKYLFKRLKSRAKKLSSAYGAAVEAVETQDEKFKNDALLFRAELDALSAASDFRAFARAAGNSETADAAFRFPRFKKDCPEDYERVKAIRKEGAAFLKEAREYAGLDRLIEKEDAVSKFSMILLALTVETDERYRRKKRDKGKLDFTDVERLAYRVLSDNERRREISEEIDAIFLDEYQDTNYLQESILLRLSRGGNVFMVGDPKQAIYRFRLAEPAIFVKKYRRYAGHDGGEKIDLNENFRSDPRILSFVNLFFESLMTDGFGGVNYKSEAWLRTGREELAERFAASTAKPVEVCLIGRERAETRREPIAAPYSVMRDATVAEGARDREGQRIAAKIKEILGEPYYDAKSDKEKPIRCGDIAVLVPKNKNAAEIRKTLVRAGIPATVGGRGKEGENSDVALLTAYLSAAYNRQDDVALIETMASPLGGFSADELASIRGAFDASRPQPEPGKYVKRYFWEAVTQYSGDETLKNKIDAMFRGLDAIRAESGYLAADALFLEAMRLTGYGAYLMGKADGGERLQKLNLYFNSIRGKDYAFRLSDYLAEAKNLATDPALPAAEGDAVRVMTFHASKGLEFPVVFAAHAGDEGGAHAAERTYFDRDFGVAVPFFDAASARIEDTVFTRAFRLKEKSERREEALRLVYVALTRAENRLYVVGKQGKSPGLFAEEGRNFADWFAYATEKNTALENYRSDFPEEDGTPAEAAADAVFRSFPLPTGAYRYPFSRSTELGVKYTVTELNEDAEAGISSFFSARSDFEGEEPSDDAEAPKKTARDADGNDGAASADSFGKPPVPGSPYPETPEDFGVGLTIDDNVSDSDAEGALPERTPKRSGGRIEGVIYHKVLQHVDLGARTSGDVSAELSRLVSEEILSKEEAGAVDPARVAACLNSEIFERARRGKALREQPFLLYLPANEVGVSDAEDKILVQGVIDLLILGEENLLVDYKDTRLDPVSAARKYRKQVSLYALAAERILGISVKKKLLYLIDRNEFIEI